MGTSSSHAGASSSSHTGVASSPPLRGEANSPGLSIPSAIGNLSTTNSAINVGLTSRSVILGRTGSSSTSDVHVGSQLSHSSMCVVHVRTIPDHEVKILVIISDSHNYVLVHR